MAKYAKADSESIRKSPPATTPEGRENQMIALAMQRSEERLRAGTASSQEIVHWLRQGSLNNRVELGILEQQKELLSAKTDAIRQSKRVDELYAEAISAMKRYAGDDPDLSNHED